MKHSPLPWMLQVDAADDRVMTIVDASGEVVLASDGSFSARDLGNLYFIAQAVNAMLGREQPGNVLYPESEVRYPPMSVEDVDAPDERGAA